MKPNFFIFYLLLYTSCVCGQDIKVFHYTGDTSSNDSLYTITCKDSLRIKTRYKYIEADDDFYGTMGSYKLFTDTFIVKRLVDRVIFIGRDYYQELSLSNSELYLDPSV